MKKRQFKKHIKTINNQQLNEIVAYETNHVRRYLAEVEWEKRNNNIPKCDDIFIDNELIELFS